MRFATRCVRKNVPRRFTPSTRSKLFSLSSSRSPRTSVITPALFTRQSRRPKALQASSTMRACWRVSATSPRTKAAPAAARRRLEVVRHHVEAARLQRERDAAPEPAVGAGHQRCGLRHHSVPGGKSFGRNSTRSGHRMTSASTASIGSSMIITSLIASTMRIPATEQQIIRHSP